MTKNYVSLKTVTAWPAEKDGEPGQGMTYPDGYQSWCPQDQFDEAYHVVDDDMDKTKRHPSVVQIMKYFAFDHLPPHLQKISRPFCLLAEITATGSGSPETTVALRKLVEAKDAAVRAAL